MSRNVKILRRNSGKIQDVEDIENVPINPNDLSSRAPLRFIHEPALNPKPSVEQAGNAKRKYDWTPTKARAKVSDPANLPLSTPERQWNGEFGRKRLAFSGVNECRDEGQSELSNYFSQSVRNVNSMVLTPRVGGTAGRANRGYLERESTYTQITPAKSVSKPPNPGFAPLTGLRHPGSARAGSYAPISRRLPVSNGQLCTVNTVEVSHFDLKEDPSFWMDHNVQVILRVRPLNNFERNTHEYNRCVKQENSQSITWIGQTETRFTFDHVACETVDQEMLFRRAGLPMVENCLSGYNSCMFAYGQTGSGKTYTMLGEMEDLEFKPSSHRGMTPRIFEFLFARISAEEESRRDEKLKYMCKCSFLEIYNEQISDLLDPTSTNLLLREDVKEGVYVENLSEFEVHSMPDVLRLLIQGSSNRKVAATDMNIESSRSHSVFTCVIESKWERDSIINQRFAKLNLVDLAGSERQKSSGAEGERLKEAANINKSLSTLGHVIMLLVDIAQGKPKHVPYRDSRLTFLLQDSLGGNSKTMIIANISPSICCATETLNTLKFAQRAKLIQNNAVVNENSSKDVAALHHQIWLLKEELSTLKRQSISRCLGFESSYTIGSGENTDVGSRPENDTLKSDNLMVCDSESSLGVSSNQLKSLDKMLVGALRREQIAETSIKQLEGEIEQLNCLVHQREEDTRCTKMMLKFREDKIQRMESLLGDLTSVDAYLLKENAALSEEIQMLRAKVDKNPEVTRFASENIRLQEQLREFQDFYEEGERDILMNEVSELRSQLILSLDKNKEQHNSNMDKDSALNVEENVSLHSELINTKQELAECQSKLNSCLESNAKLSRDVDDLHALLRNKELHINDHHDIVKEDKCRSKSGTVTHAEDVLNLELELDILKIMLKEERLSRGKLEEMSASLLRDSQQRELLVSKQYDNAKKDLKEAKSIIEGLESQQLLSLSEFEDIKNCNDRYLELLRKQEVETFGLKEHTGRPGYSRFRHFEKESPLQGQLKRMQASLDKAKGLNMCYQSDHAAQRSNEEEMDIVRRQAEAETVKVIVSLQEELSILQHRVQEKDLKEHEAGNKQLILETKSKELQETIDVISQDNEGLRQNLLEKDLEIKSLTDEWQILSFEIEGALLEGNDTLGSISDYVDSISYHIPDKRLWISEQMGRMIRHISEKESVILELNRFLEDANMRAIDMEQMLLSLRGAAIVMTESHEQDCYEKEEEILELRSELSRKTHAIAELEKRIKLGHDELMKTSTCATTAFVIVNRLSEMNYCHLDALRIMDKRQRELQEMNRKKDVSLETMKVYSDNCTNLTKQLDEQQRYIFTLERRIEDNDKYANVKAKEILEDYKIGVSMVRSSMNEYQEQVAYPEIHNSGILSVDGFSRLHEFEPVDAKTRDQNFAEPSGLLAEFEEARENMKDACIMINNLMLANRTMKVEIENLKKLNIMLTDEKDSLITEVQELQSSSELKDRNINNLEKQFEWDVSKMTSLVEDLEQSFSETQSVSEDILMSFAHGFTNMKSQIQDAVKLMHSSLEEISSEILVKDCALSVSHFCHMGVLLDAITGLDSENNLLHVGILDSNALISNLKEHNMKLREELESYRMLDVKLLADIRSNFDYISSKEGQTRELSVKISSFSEKLEILRHQEELMLERSNIMNSELDSLTEKLDQSNSTVMASLTKQEILLKSNEEDTKSEIENFLLELQMKDLELVILVSELKQLSQCNADMEKEILVCCSALDYFIANIVTLRIVADLREQLLLERESEVVGFQTISEEAKRGEAIVLTKLQKLEEEHKTLKEHMRVKEKENESFRNKLQEMESRNCTVLKDLYEKDLESKSCIDMLKLQNCRLEEDISTFESRFTLVENDLKIKKAELDDLTKTLHKKSQDFASCAAKENAMQEENFILRDELSNLRQSAFEVLGTSSSTLAKCINYTETADLQSFKMLERLDKNVKMLLDKISQNACQNLDVISGFLRDLEVLDLNVKGLVSENLCLQEELSRKDDVLNGLLLDLRFLQVSVANSTDENEKLKATLDSKEAELVMRSRELDEAVADGQALGVKMKEQMGITSAIEMDLDKANQSLKCLSGENLELRSRVEDLMTARASADRELVEKGSAIDSLENELLEMGNTLGQMNDLVESLKSNLVEVSSEKDQLQKEVMVWEEKVETAHILVEENEVIATECQQIAESRRIYAEEKEEEVKLLEGSVLELGSTISALENKVGILKEDAVRQKAKREVLESELHSLKTDIHITANPDADREISECKTHIVELTVHAEKQASRLQRAESFLLRVMEELVQYRACSGTSPAINFNEVQRLNKKL